MIFRIWSFLVCFVAGCGTAAGQVTITECGEFSLTDSAVVGLSGITWAGGNQFYVVSDRFVGFVPLTLEIDQETGKIASGKLGSPVPVKSELRDPEGIAWHGSSKTLWISSEKGPRIDGFSLTGATQSAVNLPGVFKSVRLNLGLESLTYNSQTDRFWTANEECLKGDGELSSPRGGTLVRLQEFDGAWKPLRQVAWQTEPSSVRLQNVGNGVADLCLMDNGQLLVLERGVSLLGLKMRIFLADLKGGTATNALPRLSAGKVNVVRKTLLLEKSTGAKNYEGIALGPVLKDKSRSLILVADNGSGAVHSFLALRLTGMDGSVK